MHKALILRLADSVRLPLTACMLKAQAEYGLLARRGFCTEPPPKGACLLPCDK